MRLLRRQNTYGEVKGCMLRRMERTDMTDKSTQVQGVSIGDCKRNYIYMQSSVTALSYANVFEDYIHLLKAISGSECCADLHNDLDELTVKTIQPHL